MKPMTRTCLCPSRPPSFCIGYDLSSPSPVLISRFAILNTQKQPSQSQTDGPDHVDRFPPGQPSSLPEVGGPLDPALFDRIYYQREGRSNLSSWSLGKHGGNNHRSFATVLHPSLFFSLPVWEGGKEDEGRYTGVLIRASQAMYIRMPFSVCLFLSCLVFSRL